MDARELRIGNFLFYDKKIIFISEITKAGIGMYDGYGLDKNSPFDCLRPISLTEEWLVKLGFEKYHPDKFTKGPMVITLYEHGCLYLANQRHVKFHYVHQLQNLYFALTGQELTLANEGRRDV